MRNLPTDWLRSFVTVSEVSGFTQAGQILGRTQPAISSPWTTMPESPAYRAAS